MAGRHVALLRGINVGNAKRIAMADLRALVEKLGYRNVSTLLNSGNVIFDAAGAHAPDCALKIEKAITAKLGINSRVIALSASEVAAIVKENPLEKIADNPSRLMVVIPADRSGLKLIQPLAKEKWGREVIGFGKRAAYIWCPEGIIDSLLAKAVGKLLKDAVTIRNWATTLKLQDLTKDSE